MTGDNSTTVELQSKVMIVNIKDVPDEVAVEKFDREKGHIRLKAIFKGSESQTDDANRPSESDTSNSEPV